jgi:hypothetical protein
MRKQLGLTALSLLDFLFIFPTWYGAILVGSHPDYNWLHSARISYPYIILFGAVYYLLLAGVWAWRPRLIRYFVFSTILIAVYFVAESILAISIILPTIKDASMVPWQTWWEFTSGLRAIMWAALNYWYFFWRR